MKLIGKILSTLSLAGLIGCNSNSIGRNDVDDRDVMKYDKMDYKEVIKAVETPAQARAYIEKYVHPEDSNFTNGNISFKKIHEHRKGDCSEVIVAASALLSDNGYPFLYLAMSNDDSRAGHGVFVYKEGDKWGTISINPSENYNPRFLTIEEISDTLGYKLYRLCRFHDEFIPDWISTDRDLTLTKEESSKLPKFRFTEVRKSVRVGRGAVKYIGDLEEQVMY